ncbi:hypothetical protein NDU88_004386 [Pleurodeles waltl]|uniref:Uncharacterized protein n=1 Tax=Pleurodeles waltl TaxID=8319 RepID=A0AAV7QFR7_PLEWA|nr:hypothetical protein NDU88_004386 [Pleurodeles waltl]
MRRAPHDIGDEGRPPCASYLCPCLLPSSVSLPCDVVLRSPAGDTEQVGPIPHQELLACMRLPLTRQGPPLGSLLPLQTLVGADCNRGCPSGPLHEVAVITARPALDSLLLLQTLAGAVCYRSCSPRSHSAPPNGLLSPSAVTLGERSLDNMRPRLSQAW